jgi:hypothetical protein
MKRKLLTLLAGVMLFAALALPVSADLAAEAGLPEEEGVFCFSREELEDRPALQGVFLTAVPAEQSAAVRLGSRVLRAGDAVARADLARLRVEASGGGEAVLTFLPVENGRLGEETALTFHLEKTETEPPTARPAELETWRNLPNTGTLRAEGGVGTLTFRLEDRPRRGTVDLEPDGSFTYTPKKNKVGEDSFTFTVADEAGSVSAPARVRVTIRKPTDAQTFADLDRDDQFEALWLRETGLFGGELISDRLSFGPDRTVTRGDFLAMVMDLAGIDPEIGLQTAGFADADQAATWLRPYLASALRRGLIEGEPGPDGLRFRPNDPITNGEAAALTARVLETDAALPAALTDAPEAPLTRRAAASLLYEASKTE